MDDMIPATTGDLQRFEKSLNARFETIGESFAQLHKRFDREHEDIDRVLSILVKVKNMTDNHETRIVRLEEAAA